MIFRFVAQLPHIKGVGQPDRSTHKPTSLTPLIDEVIGTTRQLAEQNKSRLVIEARKKSRRADSRSHAAPPNPAESFEQRLQVHEARRGKLKARKIVNGRNWIELAVCDTGIGA
jgi:hypothetical protein